MARKYLNGTLLQQQPTTVVGTQSRNCYDEDVAGTEQTASSMSVVDNVITEAAMTFIRTGSNNSITKPAMNNTENRGRDENNTTRTALSGIISSNHHRSSSSSSSSTLLSNNAAAISTKPHSTTNRTSSATNSNKNQAMNFVIFNENDATVSNNNSNNTKITKSVVGMMNTNTTTTTTTVVKSDHIVAPSKAHSLLNAPTWNNLGAEESRRKENSGINLMYCCIHIINIVYVIVNTCY